MEQSALAVHASIQKFHAFSKIHLANSKIHLANITLDFSVLLNNHYELHVVFIRVVKP